MYLMSPEELSSKFPLTSRIVVLIWISESFISTLPLFQITECGGEETIHWRSWTSPTTAQESSSRLQVPTAQTQTLERGGFQQHGTHEQPLQDAPCQHVAYWNSPSPWRKQGAEPHSTRSDGWWTQWTSDSSNDTKSSPTPHAILPSWSFGRSSEDACRSFKSFW